MYNSLDETGILSEFQISFITFFLGQNFSGFEQWKNIISLICSCKDAVLKFPMLYIKFLGNVKVNIIIDSIIFMVIECPPDLFDDIINEQNFLFIQFKVISSFNIVNL